MARRSEDITMEGVQIIARNFSGRVDAYNPAGKRTFLVLLDDETAVKMDADGWNVKYLKPREDGDVPKPFLKVTVNMKGDFPPRVVMIAGRNQTRMDIDTIELLDTADISNVDLIINPYHYEASPVAPAGIAAYLRAGYFTINQDDLERKYADLANTPENDAALADMYSRDDIDI